jgi:hypothetical protein
LCDLKGVAQELWLGVRKKKAKRPQEKRDEGGVCVSTSLPATTIIITHHHLPFPPPVLIQAAIDLQVRIEEGTRKKGRKKTLFSGFFFASIPPNDFLLHDPNVSLKRRQWFEAA